VQQNANDSEFMQEDNEFQQAQTLQDYGLACDTCKKRIRSNPALL
jgi:hypothetical protein